MTSSDQSLIHEEIDDHDYFHNNLVTGCDPAPPSFYAAAMERLSDWRPFTPPLSELKQLRY